jgi:hypothetical protein
MQLAQSLTVEVTRSFVAEAMQSALASIMETGPAAATVAMVVQMQAAVTAALAPGAHSVPLLRLSARQCATSLARVHEDLVKQGFCHCSLLHFAFNSLSSTHSALRVQIVCIRRMFAV